MKQLEAEAEEVKKAVCDLEPIAEEVEPHIEELKTGHRTPSPLETALLPPLTVRGVLTDFALEGPSGPC